MKRSHPVFLLLLGLTVAALEEQARDKREPLKITIGPEIRVFPEGLQPFMFLSRNGVVVVQAQLPIPVEKEFPGRWGAVRSSDRGRTWSPWTPAAAQKEGPFMEGSATQLRDGTIMVLEWVARGPKEGGYFIGKLWESRDEWKALSGPTEARIYLPEGTGGFDDGGKPVNGLFIHRTLLEMPNGDLIATAYGWFRGDNRASTYMENMNKFRSVLLRSKDRGRNWSLVSTIAVDPTIGEEGFDEPVLVRLTQGKGAGRFVVLLRTGSNKVIWPNPIYQTESDDEGKTWSKPRPLPFDGVNPDLIEMMNGILVAGFGWRTRESREKKGSPEQPRRLGREHGNYVAFSLDQGETWSQITRVTEQPTTAYVTVREIRPNELFLVYDTGDWWTRRWVGYEKGIDRYIGGRILEVKTP